MKKTIAVLPGDGVGPEVAREAMKVLKAIASKFNHKFDFVEGLIGAVAIDKTGDPYPKATHAICQKADAILFGAIGDPKYDLDPSAIVRPEQGLLTMRKNLGLYANIRPVCSYPQTAKLSPIREELVKNVDFVVVRELTGGIYFGKKGRKNNGNEAFDICTYSKAEIIRVAKVAFGLAVKRKQKLTLVDKANVLETSRLWRETVKELAKNYPAVEVDYMFVDNAAMQIIKRPSSFDVVLTENMFGDILTDETSVIAGSLGMLPSASIGEKVALYEPIHGSYPKAKGKNTANPIGAILSAAMMLEMSFGLKDEARVVYEAVQITLDNEVGTKDIFSQRPVVTSDFGSQLVKIINNLSI